MTNKNTIINNQSIMVSLLMLIGTAIALTTASYAWFSVNSTVTINGLEINVNAAEGIQVSTDAQTWKASLDISDLDPVALDNAGAGKYTFAEGQKNHLGTTIVPVSTIGSQTAGNFEMFVGTLVEDATTTLTTSAITEDNTTGEFIAFDVFIKTATTENIYLMNGSHFTYQPVDVEASVGLEWATRVAFLDQGNDATSSPALSKALANGTSADQVIWEPHALSNTVFALSNGAVAGVKETYYGVKAANTGLTVVKSEQQTDADGAAVNFGNVTTITPDTDGTQWEVTPSNIIFTVEPGINKIRIIMWLEGQDIDCENSISLGLGNVTSTIKFQKA